MTQAFARRSSRRRRGGRSALLLSMTPLTDVVFILLVFFMLASSFLDWRGIEISAGGRGGSGIEGLLLLRLHADGRLDLGGQAIALEDVSGRVGAAGREGKAPQVALQVEPGVPLQSTVDVITQARAGGATTFTLVGTK